MQRRLATSVIAFALVAACSGPRTSTASPTATPGALAGAPAATPTYLSPSHGYSVALPAPYRYSARLSLDSSGGRPAWQDAFTARTPTDEGKADGSGQTASPIWNYVAVIQAYADAGSDTPRTFYARSSGATGETIVDATLDGRPAIKVTNGAVYPVQYIVKDGSRILRIGYQIYGDIFKDLPGPAGASREKLVALIESLRFMP